MRSQELAKAIDVSLYPEVAASGSLSNALDNTFVEIGSPLRCTAEMNFVPLAFARAAGGSRFCQVYIAAHKHLFILDFWSRGVAYGKGTCSSLEDAARAIHCWIIEEPAIAQMQDTFAFFVPSEEARAHETGNAVQHQWETLLKRWVRSEERHPGALSPRPLIEAAMKRRELRQLFPFTSLYSLHFSRTTGYPFTNDCPFATPIGSDRFRAYAPRRSAAAEPEAIGEGSADEVIAMLVANVPPNCGPAIAGTAEDLSEEN